MAERIVLAALDAEALHAEGARQVVAILGLLDHLVAVGAHLQALALGCGPVDLLDMVLAGDAMVPGLLGEVAELKIAGHAPHLELVGLREGDHLLAASVGAHGIEIVVAVLGVQLDALEVDQGLVL